MQHPPNLVCTFLRQRDVPVLIPVESSAPVDQLANRGRSFVSEKMNGIVSAQAIAGRQGIGRMTVRGISLPDRCGDPTLRVDGTAFLGTGLRQDQHVAGLDQLKCRPQRSDAATNDEKVALDVAHSRSTVAAHIASVCCILPAH